MDGSVVSSEEGQIIGNSPSAAPPVLSVTEARSPGTGFAEPLLASAHMGSGWMDERESSTNFSPALARENELGILGDNVCLTLSPIFYSRCFVGHPSSGPSHFSPRPPSTCSSQASVARFVVRGRVFL